MKNLARYAPAAALIALLAWSVPAAAQEAGSPADPLEEEAAKRGKTSKDPAERMLESLQRAQDGMEKTLNAADKASAEQRDKLVKGMEAQYATMLKRMEEQRELMRKRVEQQWTRFYESTNKEWVSYGDKTDTLSKVDFEKGQIEVEVLVPVEDATAGKKKTADYSALDPKEQERLKVLAEEKVREQTKKVISEKAEETTEILKDQIATPDGRVVTEKDADRFVKEQLAPKLEVEEKPVVAKDGKPRLKVKVKVPMVPEHLSIRAERYRPQIEASAGKYGLDPALVTAVVHTESYFNPLAKSAIPAFGLMQLVPRSAAKEAYGFLHKEEKLLTPEYLYDPGNNILLGTTYLHLLMTRYFRDIKDPGGRTAASIAAYNCGPTQMRRKILSGRDLGSLDGEETSRLIAALAPKETRDYVPKVLERMELHRKR